MAEEGTEVAARPSGEEGTVEGVAAGAAPAPAISDSTLKGSSVLEKHSLHHSWCLWALVRDQSTKDNWHGSMMKVGEFDTVEDFWRHFNNILRPSRLGTGDFSLFKKDIAPAWEDETCKHGGRWIAKLDSKTPPEDFDSAWLDLVLSLLGEDFERVGGQMVCGAVISARARGSGKIALWVSERQQEKVLRIGHAFAKVLGDAAGFAGDIHFEDFSEGGKALFSLKDT